MKTVNSQIRVQQNSSNKNKETRTRCIIIQLLKTSNKEEIFKAARKKKYIYISPGGPKISREQISSQKQCKQEIVKQHT